MMCGWCPCVARSVRLCQANSLSNSRSTSPSGQVSSHMATGQQGGPAIPKLAAVCSPVMQTYVLTFVVICILSLSHALELLLKREDSGHHPKSLFLT